MTTPNFTAITGKGRYGRAIRELQAAVLRGSNGQGTGTLVSVTPRGTIITPDGSITDVSRPQRTTESIPRWG